MVTTGCSRKCHKCRRRKKRGKFGDADGILDALARYDSIPQLEREKADHEAKMEEEKSAAREHLEKINAEISAREQTLQGLQASVDEAKKALARYQSLVDRGFDLPLLQQVTELAEKYGSPSELLEAVNSFKDLTDIRARCDEANSDLQTLQHPRLLRQLEVGQSLTAYASPPSSVTSRSNPPPWDTLVFDNLDHILNDIRENHITEPGRPSNRALGGFLHARG